MKDLVFRLMAEKVKLSKDGSSIDFVQSDSLPTSLKKFRQSPEIEGFYRFIYENDLQKEAYEVLERIIHERKSKKAMEKAAQKAALKAQKAEAAAGIARTKAEAKSKELEKKSTAKSSSPPKVVAFKETGAKGLDLKSKAKLLEAASSKAPSSKADFSGKSQASFKPRGHKAPVNADVRDMSLKTKVAAKSPLLGKTKAVSVSLSLSKSKPKAATSISKSKAPVKEVAKPLAKALSKKSVKPASKPAAKKAPLKVAAKPSSKAKSKR
ncbi:MAG: hypothetical protein WCH11_07215 [Bdellovibrio sp.]